MADFSVYHGNEKEGSQLTSSRRYDQFLGTWRSINKRVHRHLGILNKNVLTEIFDFITSSHASWLSSHKIIDQIPTALLLAGVNTPDHSVIYGHLKKSILNSGGHVAVISPGANTTSVRNLVSLVVQQLSDDSFQQCGFLLDDKNSGGDSKVATCKDFDESNNISVNNFTPATRFSYLALVESYYSKVKNHCGTNVLGRNTEYKTLAPPTTPCLRSKRRISQPISHGVSTISPGSEISSESKPKSTVLGPLVIILTETESIPVQVLCDFISLTSLYAAGQIRGRSYSLPISFVFGLSTIPEFGFESRLNASTLSRLTIRRFAVPPPSAFLDVVLNEIIKFPGLHPTYSVLNYLIDGLFLCLDYSVKNFLQRLKFCMLEHYLKTPHPELLQSLELARKYLISLNPSDLARIVSLDYPSLGNHVLDNVTTSALATISPPEVINISSPPGTHRITHRSSSSSSRLIDKIIEYLENHLKLQYLIPPVLNWLLIIMTPLSVRPLGKNIGDLYRLWLKNGLVNAEEFNMTINLLNGVSKEHLLTAVQNAYEFLHQESSSLSRSKDSTSLWSSSVVTEGRICLNDLADATLSWHTKLSLACQESINKQSQQQSTDSEMSSTITTSVNNDNEPVKPIEFNTKRKISLRNLRQHLQEYATSSPNRSMSAISTSIHNTQWEITRKEFLRWIQIKLSEIIPPFNQLPLHEVFYGPSSIESGNNYSLSSSHEDSSIHSQLALSIRRRLNPPLQRCLHQALVNPGVYLQITDLKLSNSSSISSKLFDLCILYKLLLETSKIVNLYDWLMAFATILGESVDSQNPPSQEIQCRFLQGLAELQHLGCIKSTRRKVDHVIRLTWISGFML
ncbi:Origin recognition complex subunit 3 [Schistosoma japonicum]|uniref:Origin recognition complex subunit 3 n=1 Tax=Schistosoma japonicum TaxID=6182 RepID=A0A4Z2CRC9_SCHJA|nr:Origin recognition complex subunit 3 [Schistosoma japonicum]